ncbi:hypothetical protein [Dysgonomonas macrotermitis]|uniref:Uncharacterized protein n=1 Tax=Dysgonomonas macrotermitis TaxID=1346286 RepID=A0A1M5GKX7_9BACT|nr:hypothetical protein [Dysgonomonas macrotermitis]SHG04405.1 hypothetical protein SAMN05444362_11451 [Dysgonomonas macrotermitis]
MKYQIRKVDKGYILLRVKDEAILYVNGNFMNVVYEAQAIGILNTTEYKY